MTSTSQQNYQTNFIKPIATGVIVHDAPGQKQPHSSWLSRTWKYLLHHLLRGHEPQVWQKHTAAGEVFYYGYDPRTGSSIHGATEAEIRAWLDPLCFSDQRGSISE